MKTTGLKKVFTGRNGCADYVYSASNGMRAYINVERRSEPSRTLGKRVRWTSAQTIISVRDRKLTIIESSVSAVCAAIEKAIAEDCGVDLCPLA